MLYPSLVGSWTAIVREGKLAAVTCVVGLMLVASHSAPAQTFAIIHNFTGGQDGATPMAGLAIDKAGNFYGTAAFGGIVGGQCGTLGCGTVFRLANRNSGWVLTPLYSFVGGNDGISPQANVVVGPEGALYGSTYLGGGTCDGDGCGTIFSLRPPASACKSALCPWTEEVLHTFSGRDGIGPVGVLVFDQSGNAFGATSSGGFLNGGTVFKLQRMGGGWVNQVLYSPYGYPRGGLNFDNSGNLFGTAFTGGKGQGYVYRLTPSDTGWIETDLYDFTNQDDGGYPWAGMIFDASGNLYGATTSGGSGHGGTAFELTNSGGTWTLNTLYSFAGPGNGRFVVGPVGNLVMDSAGALYGTTFADGAYGFGAVFKLTPSNGGWTYTSLHDFTSGSDGGNPYSNLVFDASGNMYGTASVGGTGPCAGGCGVVFEITP